MTTKGCRFYEEKFPEVEQAVMVNVFNVAEMGAYVHLLEYGDIQGMILLSELSRRRIRSINKLIRVGRNECVIVLRVDREKGYIDLSKRRVTPEEVEKTEDKYNKAKAVNSVLRHVADTLKMDLEELYKQTAWPLDKKYGGPGKSYEAFKLAITDSSVINALEGVSDQTKEALLGNIRRRMAPQPTKIRADVEVSCFQYEGIDAVKKALRCGLALSTEEMPIKINLIAPPLYVMTTMSLDKDQGLAALNAVVKAVDDDIRASGGSTNTIKAPHAVTENDEKELAKVMEELQRKQTNVDGDDDNSDGEASASDTEPSGIASPKASAADEDGDDD